MATKSPEEVSHLINDVLRKDLEEVEKYLDKTNSEISEYMQLEKTIEFLKDKKSEGFKTKVDVGCNMFMLAKVDKIEPILINVGLGVYLELEITEALKFLKMKVNALNREADVMREQSLKIRTEIKILLMYLSETQNLNTIQE